MAKKKLTKREIEQRIKNRMVSDEKKASWHGGDNGAPKVEPARFSKAGEPTKRTVAEAIERMRTELQIAYGNDYTFVVMDSANHVIASHRSGLNHDTFIACTKEG